MTTLKEERRVGKMLDGGCEGSWGCCWSSPSVTVVLPDDHVEGPGEKYVCHHCAGHYIKKGGWVKGERENAVSWWDRVLPWREAGDG